MYNPFSLIGKTILVTGASSGIGRATAVECSKMGAKLIITGRNEERLQQTLCLLNGDNHMLLCCNLSQEDDIKALCAQLPNNIDGVAHCAGISSLKPIIGLNTQRKKKKHLISIQSLLNNLISLYACKKWNKC